jgi:hypothetical protein
MSGTKFDRITGCWNCFKNPRERMKKFEIEISFHPLGLDPALPFFATARKHWKLDSSDG